MASNNKVLTIDITNESITIVEVTPSNKKQSTIHTLSSSRHRKMPMRMA